MPIGAAQTRSVLRSVRHYPHNGALRARVVPHSAIQCRLSSLAEVHSALPDGANETVGPETVSGPWSSVEQRVADLGVEDSQVLCVLAFTLLLLQT